MYRRAGMAQQIDVDQMMDALYSGDTPAPFDIFARVEALENEVLVEYEPVYE
jgi:hypothetical protein